MTPDPRRLAIDALVRIDAEGAFANVVVPGLLDSSGLPRRDRAFVTQLVYGATRRRRALDYLVDPYLVQVPPPRALAALRIGAYQLAELGTPRHAAVSATVGASPKRYRGLVNAVLRRVADRVEGGFEWPDPATELSYPDWVVDRLVADLGAEGALAALGAMNEPAIAHRRDDGYVQDLSSQLVVESLPVTPGDLAFDLCAAPGGKATALAGRGARVVAVDLNPARARLIAENRRVLASEDLHIVIADSTGPPLRAARADLVLVDAPCSGLGALRRRPDARWRIEESDVDRLAELQARILGSAADLVAPGGILAYSVCTLTAAETCDVATGFTDGRFEPVPVTEPWEALGTGGMLLPDGERDGMTLFTWLRSG